METLQLSSAVDPPFGFRLPGSVENKAALFSADLRPEQKTILSEKSGITKQEFVKCSLRYVLAAVEKQVHALV